MTFERLSAGLTVDLSKLQGIGIGKSSFANSVGEGESIKNDIMAGRRSFHPPEIFWQEKSWRYDFADDNDILQ